MHVTTDNYLLESAGEYGRAGVNRGYARRFFPISPKTNTGKVVPPVLGFRVSQLQGAAGVRISSVPIAELSDGI